MQDQDKPEKKHRRNKGSEFPKSILILLLIILLAAGAWFTFFFGTEESREPVGVESLETSGQTLSEEDRRLLQPSKDDATPGTGQETLSTTAEDARVEEPVFAQPVIETPEEKRARECNVLAEQVNGFFTHVDSEDYMKQFELQEPSQQYFIALTYKLLKNPPVVSRESDDLYTILKNMAHFFRVIGKDNIILIKTILDRERDKIEDVAAELYQWTTWDTCNSDMLQFSPSLKEMYEYAGFFLNTMGGRSYLFRRDSRSRLLVNYYSVLLIDRANSEGINRHGIDISQIIPQLIQEIDSSTQLIYKENYIDSLDSLLEKYE